MLGHVGVASEDWDWMLSSMDDIHRLRRSTSRRVPCGIFDRVLPSFVKPFLLHLRPPPQRVHVLM